jgi:hypothetical protein
MLLLSIKAIYLYLLPRSLLSVSISLDLITTTLIYNLLVTCMDARIEYVVFAKSGRTLTKTSFLSFLFPVQLLSFRLTLEKLMLSVMLEVPRMLDIPSSCFLSVNCLQQRGT